MNTRAPVAAARSYTLIELLIVVAVLGLAAAILTPQLVARDAMAVQAAVRMVIADVTYAQSDALANQEYRVVYFWTEPGGTGFKYSLIRWETGGGGFPLSGPPPSGADYLMNPIQGTEYTVDFQSVGRFEGVHFDMASSTIDGVDGDPDGVYLIFDALGGTVRASDITAPGTGGQVVIECEDERYEIAFSAFTGKMTVNKL